MSDAARRMMSKMGWSEGDGLGKEGQGLKTAIKPTKKIDNSGIGAVKSNTRWVEASAGYDAILAKLNIAYGDGDNESDGGDEKKKEKKEKKKEKKDKKEKKKKKKDKKRPSDSDKSTSRHLIYAKRLKSKQVGGYTDKDKAEIFGGEARKASVTPTPPPVSRAVVIGTIVDSDDDVEPEPEMTKVDYVSGSGFTEDTQAQIYSQAMESKIQHRRGLGLSKMSKSTRKQHAMRDAALVGAGVGKYLSSKFVYGGSLADYDVVKLRKTKEAEKLAYQEELRLEEEAELLQLQQHTSIPITSVVDKPTKAKKLKDKTKKAKKKDRSAKDKLKVAKKIGKSGSKVKVKGKKKKKLTA